MFRIMLASHQALPLTFYNKFALVYHWVQRWCYWDLEFLSNCKFELGA